MLICVALGKFSNLSHKYNEVIIIHYIVVIIQCNDRTFSTIVKCSIVNSFLFVLWFCGLLHRFESLLHHLWRNSKNILSPHLIFLVCKLGIIMNIYFIGFFCKNKLRSR